MKSETDLKSELAKAISISTAKHNQDKGTKYFHNLKRK
jgi:hypothetical protein